MDFKALGKSMSASAKNVGSSARLAAQSSVRKVASNVPFARPLSGSSGGQRSATSSSASLPVALAGGDDAAAGGDERDGDSAMRGTKRLGEFGYHRDLTEIFKR